MKKIAYLFSAAAFAALSTLTSCKKDKETPVDNNPEAPVVTSTMTTTNGGNTGTAIASMDVTTSTGTAKIRLDVTSTVDLDKIYIMKSEDNGSLQAVTVADVASQAGATFTGGSANYSLSVPGSTKSFIIDIPVSVRTTSAAVTDVYYVWITNGTGAFTKPTKNTVLGPAIITLKYTSAAPAYTYHSFSATLASQLNNTVGSLLVTSGQGGVLSTPDYDDAPTSVDLSLSSLNSTGTALGTNSNWLISPDQRGTVGFSNEPTSPAPNATIIEAYSGSATFDNATGSDLNSLTFGTGNKVQITAGGVYQFKTATGKKGLIKVSSSYVYSTGTTATVDVTVKVLN
ncbi:MAG TPA: hypothetical protein VNB90_10145 [Cytophagaceae bacterium]|jgi:hypothetical protein|nr:hypothetical protein [Cytophagaceae bacterium]